MKLQTAIIIIVINFAIEAGAWKISTRLLTKMLVAIKLKIDNMVYPTI